MLNKASKQMITGKSFEYSLLTQFEKDLKPHANIQVLRDSSFEIAKQCFESVSVKEQREYSLTAQSAISFLTDTDPRLSCELRKDDVLQIGILSDDHGKSGDVRDVVIKNMSQKWEIGISAKNNHHAVKHSRLSANIDFGEKWLGMKSSQEYFNTVTPLFDTLAQIRTESGATKKWSELGDYHSTIYVPILKAFIKELKDLHAKDAQKVASNLVTYLVGNQDFYKVIKSKKSVEIEAHNIQGTLNTIPKLSLPTRILDINFKSGSDTTAIVTMDNDWALSFRIHNASSRVEPSLKFDITLLNSPKNLFNNTLSINHS